MDRAAEHEAETGAIAYLERSLLLEGAAEGRMTIVEQLAAQEEGQPTVAGLCNQGEAERQGRETRAEILMLTALNGEAQEAEAQVRAGQASHPTTEQMAGRD